MAPPIRPTTQGGYAKALFVVGDASRWLFVVLLKTTTMAEVANALRHVLIAVSGDAHVLRTRRLRTDNGTEFINSAVSTLIVNAGIQHERTCPHTSHQNGVAERAIGKTMAMVRTMMAAASAPTYLWGEALLAAVHVSNRLPTSANEDNASPFQVRFGRRPSVAHLQPWGIGGPKSRWELRRECVVPGCRWLGL